MPIAAIAAPPPSGRRIVLHAGYRRGSKVRAPEANTGLPRLYRHAERARTQPAQPRFQRHRGPASTHRCRPRHADTDTTDTATAHSIDAPFADSFSQHACRHVTEDATDTHGSDDEARQTRPRRPVRWRRSRSPGRLRLPRCRIDLTARRPARPSSRGRPPAMTRQEARSPGEDVLRGKEGWNIGPMGMLSRSAVLMTTSSPSTTRSTLKCWSSLMACR